MTTDDRRAAAESYVDRASGNHCPTHREQLMQAYLAGAGRYAPPADDAEPVTDGWLEATIVGLNNDDVDWNWKDTDYGRALWVEFRVRGRWWDVPLPDHPTRGAVRRLLAALGISG